MRAMQIIEWGKPLEAREYPDPEPKGEEVLLRVEAAGVCHSDVHIWDGYFDMGGERRISLESRGVHLPFTMGHEIAGEVAALGPHASGVQVGDKVVAYPWIGCGECAVCRKGEELLCLNPRTLGTRRAGGYGTHVAGGDRRGVARTGLAPIGRSRRTREPAMRTRRASLPVRSEWTMPRPAVIQLMSPGRMGWCDPRLSR